MSLDPGSHGPSPISSGRSSPQPRRRIDEDVTRRDPKYKRFASSIDRALALFESNSLQEWADYISFLNRLLKALQAHPSLPNIPSKVLVAQRLAQCLNPQRPSGVHQKTIEVYSYIFSLIGRDGLATDLTLWTPGLASVLSYASLTVKPHYLDLLERFYPPLGMQLRPALRSLILALLPGIDEEGGEYFDRTLALIDAIRKSVQDDAYFWQCLLLATITSAGRRQGALTFLTRRLPKLGGRGAKVESNEGETQDSVEEEAQDAELQALISPEPGLLVRAVCAGLSDEQLLVQRGFLDLLVTNLPLSSEIIQEKVSKQDVQLLAISAAGVVMRRDMGLNRRLWVWFLGPEESRGLEYFERHGAQPLVNGLLSMLNLRPEATPAQRARPYRICLSLMDRWEVGSVVAPRLFIPAMEHLRAYEVTAPSKDMYTEVFRSASMFFDGVEARLIWGQILEKVMDALSNDDEQNMQKLEAVKFIIRTFNVREEEMVVIHAPLVVLVILWRLAEGFGGFSPGLRDMAYVLAQDLWRLIPEGAFRYPSSSHQANTNDTNNTAISPLKQVTAFYDRSEPLSPSSSSMEPPFPLVQISRWGFQKISFLLRTAIETGTTTINTASHLFVEILYKAPLVDDQPTVKSLVTCFLETLSGTDAPFSVLEGMADIVAALHDKEYLERGDTNALVASIVKRIWFYLSPDTPKYHVEAVRALWKLQSVLHDRRIEAAIARSMVFKDRAGPLSVRTAEQGGRFAVLWMHSAGGLGGSAYHMMLTRPLFLFLDSLADDSAELSVFARAWLQNLGSIHKLFYIFIAKLLDCSFLKDPGPRDGEGAPLHRPLYQADENIDLGTYYFQTLSNVLRYATNHVLAALANETVVGGDEHRAKALFDCGYGETDFSLQGFFVHAALRALEGDPENDEVADRVSKLHKMSLGVMHQLLLSPYAKPLADMELENCIAARLISIMATKETYVQVSLLDVLHASLKLSLNRPTSQLGRLRQASQDAGGLSGAPRISVSSEQEKTAPPPQLTPPQQLQRCLLSGFSQPSCRPILDSWIFFLGECLPLLTDVVFQMLIPLVGCLCTQIKSTFESLKEVFKDNRRLGVPESPGRSPESTLVALLNGLEQVLATAHDRLQVEDARSVGNKSPDAPTAGFFGSMVSGVFSGESHQSNQAANNRLTVLLCFQDTVRICHSIWGWGDAHNVGGSLDASSKESWQYTSLRMKGRARRILEHMFAAETLECLETLVELWPGRTAPLGKRNVGSIFKLINVLDGSRPKHTIPAIFNAIYSRTNPSALDPSRRSTLTAELTDMDVVVFLVEYARSLEDDAMDEIWSDCMVFLKDVLANPFPHRQTLPSLIHFAAILGEKVDNTNFGEQRKMRRELGDVFLRLLTAAFSVSPAGQRMLEPPPTAPVLEKTSKDEKSERVLKGRTMPDDIVLVLDAVIPELRKVVVEQERVMTCAVTISTSLLGPTFRSKAFPQNVSAPLLDLTLQISRIPNSQKAWKKELSDVFLDPRFFAGPVGLVKEKWVPLLRQYLLSDRERMADLLSRLAPPSAAGVIFGVGAASVRQEMDRKTAYGLKRVAFLIYAAEHDAFVAVLTSIEDKLVELLSATNVSSPSSATRGMVYLVLRALSLRISPEHLSTLWPLINTELQNALTALFPDGDPEKTYTENSILHACRLLDTLLVLAPDEFQLHEWLFVTDTIEAVYHSHDWNPVALVDQVAMSLASGAGSSGWKASDQDGVGRKPWFAGGEEVERANIRRDLIAPFVRSLSIACYEGAYTVGRPDVLACEDGFLRDLFEDGGA